MVFAYFLVADEGLLRDNYWLNNGFFYEADQGVDRNIKFQGFTSGKMDHRRSGPLLFQESNVVYNDELISRF